MDTTTDSSVIYGHINGDTGSSTIKLDVSPLTSNSNTNFTLTNGLLIFIIVYIILKDIAKYINSWIRGGMV